MIRLTPPGISILPLFPKLQPGEEALKSSLCTEINRQLSVLVGSRHEACRSMAVRGEEEGSRAGECGWACPSVAQKQAQVRRAQVVIQARAPARGRGEPHFGTPNGTPSRWESLCGHCYRVLLLRVDLWPPAGRGGSRPGCGDFWGSSQR